MTTLVTGATGLLGNNIVRLLLDRGEQVRVLTRSTSDPRPLAGLPMQIIPGDVTNAETVFRAMAGAKQVIHSAGYVQIGWKNLNEHRAVNIEGTHNVAFAARNVGARMVHISSVDALGIGTREQPADEDTLPSERNVNCPYVVTKREAEQAVQAEIRQGLNATLVLPTFMLGPWDWKPSSGRMLLAVAKGFTPFAPRGGNNFVDVRDVAAGTLAALERGEVGRRYILGGEDWTYLDIWRLFARLNGKKGPVCRTGPVNAWIAGAAGDFWGILRGREPEVNSAAMAMSRLPHYFKSDRARRELGYTVRPVSEAAAAAWQWFQEHQYV